jgi:hypothetical protein
MSFKLASEHSFCLLDADSVCAFNQIVDSRYDFLLERLWYIISRREVQVCGFSRSYPCSDVFLSDLSDALVDSAVA